MKKPLTNPKWAVLFFNEADAAKAIKDIVIASLYAKQCETWATHIIEGKKRVAFKGSIIDHKFYSEDVRNKAKMLLTASQAFIRVIADSGVDNTELYEISAQIDDGVQEELKPFIESILNAGKEEKE